MGQKLKSSLLIPGMGPTVPIVQLFVKLWVFLFYKASIMKIDSMTAFKYQDVHLVFRTSATPC